MDAVNKSKNFSKVKNINSFKNLYKLYDNVEKGVIKTELTKEEKRYRILSEVFYHLFLIFLVNLFVYPYMGNYLNNSFVVMMGFVVSFLGGIGANLLFKRKDFFTGIIYASIFTFLLSILSFVFSVYPIVSTVKGNKFLLIVQIFNSYLLIRYTMYAGFVFFTTYITGYYGVVLFKK